MSITDQIKYYRFLERYANSPIIPPTKEEALNRLRKLGIIDENGNSRSDIFDGERKDGELEEAALRS